MIDYPKRLIWRSYNFPLPFLLLTVVNILNIYAQTPGYPTTIHDLQRALPYFTQQANAWTVSSTSASSVISSDCGSANRLGGYGVLSAPGSFQYTYPALVSHVTVLVSIELALIDNWRAGDEIIVEVDSNSYTIQVTNAQSAWASNFCGSGSYKDAMPVYYEGHYSHTANQVTIKVSKSNTNINAQFAIRSVDIAYSNWTTAGGANLRTEIANVVTSTKTCPMDQIKVSGVCEDCPDGCVSCVSSGTICYTCKPGYYYYDGACTQCHSSCSSCSGTGSNQCFSCADGLYLYSNSTCSSTCSAPYTPREARGERYCELCTTLSIFQTSPVSQYYHPGDATCQASCVTPFQSRQDGNDLYCQLCLSSNTENYAQVSSSTLYYFPTNTTCRTSCEPPYYNYLTSGDYYCELCPTGKFYIQGSGCSGDCSLGCETCTSGSICYSCDTHTTLVNSACRCPSGSFYVQGSACSGQCPTYCDYCTEATTCIECTSPLVWVSSRCQCPSPKVQVGSSCECPSGTVENPSTSLCDSVQFLEITYQALVSPYADLVIQARITPEEEASSTPVFSWTFSSGSANSAQLATLQGYLTSQTTKNLIVPASGSYLQPGITYTVVVSYTNPNGILVSKSVSITTTITLQASIRGGSMQTLDYSAANSVSAEVFAPNGTKLLTSSLVVLWSQSGGTALNLAALTSSQMPLVLTIPKCTLVLGNSYSFTVTAQLRGAGQTPTTAEVVIVSPPPQISVTIPNSNRLQKPNVDLVLQPVLSLQDKCNTADINSVIDASTSQYTWECSKINALGATTVCSDPLSLFYPPRSSSSLTVPTSYFSQDEGVEFAFKLTVTARSASSSNLLVANTQTSYTISSADNPAVSLSKNSNMIQVTLDTSQHSYTYSWDFTPQVQYVAFGKEVKILTDLNSLSSLNIPYVRAKLTAIDETGATTILYYQLPINQPPQNGIITVNPTSGTSLETNFFISTNGWIDEDIPFTYQFFYSQSATGDYNTLCSPQLSSFISAQLVSSSQPNVYVKVVVTDNLGGSNSKIIQVTVQPDTDVLSATSNIQALLAMQSEVSPSEMMNLLNTASASLGALEAAHSSTNGCPSCSGHGQCINNNCVCDPGYTLGDCSMTQTEYDSISAIRTSLLQAMVDTAGRLDDPDSTVINTLAGNLEVLSSSVTFNSVSSLTTMQNIVETTLKVNNASTILTSTQAISVANIMSNMLTYASTTDSSMNNAFSSNLETKMNQYLTVASNSLLANMIPGDAPAVISTPNFGMYVSKTTMCTIASQNITISADYPSLQVTPPADASLTGEACTTPLDLTYYAVNTNLFNGDGSSAPVIALNIRNSDTGEPITNVGVKVMPYGDHQCPRDCDRVEGGCVCTDVFDVGGQFSKVFRKSNVGKLGGIGSLAGFKFWESLAVWSTIGFSVWFGVSLYFVKVKKPNYNIIDGFRSRQKALRSKFRQIQIMFMITHPMLSIYSYKDELISKTTKLILYYQQVIFMLTYTAVFPGAGDENAIPSKIVLITVKSATVTPLTLIIMYLIKDLDPNDKTKMTWFKKNKRKIGMIFSILCTIACMYMIVIISAQTEASVQNEWTINFLVVIIQSILVGPPVSLAIQMSMLVYKSSTQHKKPNILNKVLSRVINKDIEKNYNQVCQDQGNSPSSSEIIIITPSTPQHLLAENAQAVAKETSSASTSLDFHKAKRKFTGRTVLPSISTPDAAKDRSLLNLTKKHSKLSQPNNDQELENKPLFERASIHQKPEPNNHVQDLEETTRNEF